MKPMIVIGNWKMNGNKKTIKALINDISVGLKEFVDIDIAVCPPFPYLGYTQKLLTSKGSNLKLGAQNLYAEPHGAFTGEVSPNMLKDFNCQYVLVGHSERRQLFGETDLIVAKKFITAYYAGLNPVLCVGETAEQRAAGKTFEVLAGQLEAVFKLDAITAFNQKALIAYEPIWAVGTGKAATESEAQEVHSFLRNLVRLRHTKCAEKVQIIYGGSVTPKNAHQLFRQTDIDGGLIGGASLREKEFLMICKHAQESGSQWNN